MPITQAANLVLRFLLELCMLAALGYWGYWTGQGTLAKVGLAICAPLLAAMVWGVFISPKAAVRVPRWLWLVLQGILFGCAAAALATTGHPFLATVLLLLVAINSILLYAWRS
jgi:hypothetical protein